jgi:cyclopropane-fatty-acyl-phospholipid synthase
MDSVKTIDLTAPAAGGMLDRALRTRLLQQMNALRDCQLRIVDALGENLLCTPAADPADTLHATLRVYDAAFYRHVAGNGSVGAGEAYMDGLWHCDDLVALMRMLVRNRDLLDAMETGLARLGGIAMKAWHAFKRNTRRGASSIASARSSRYQPMIACSRSAAAGAVSRCTRRSTTAAA